ncbi:restriction endonuclease subunit S [Apibacter sp. ESL0404]|uniref:restriction endonuclease subunit S n=1 Tax=Apibacter sp. ESL0404 TaxID=2704651 RepID=UPI001C6A5F18|nr:restriction endonuclease subunit S [Apibacter sp. ESL0404]QYN50898.1 hypothetical protein GYM72_04905 [Apibacter sp. ESL0404]
MSKKTKLIPELRFPEFVDEGEWEEKKLIETTEERVKWSFAGGPFGSNLKATDYTKEGIRIIQLQNIGDGEFNDDYKIYTSEEKANELLSCNIYSGEIILSKMGDPVGRACIIPDILKRCVMASDGIRLVVDEKRYSKYFIYSLINSIHIRTAIEKKATGSTRKRIGLDELKAVKLIIPQKLEQQKIASCLSSLDEMIADQGQKLDLLKDHKKGLMQKLFPQEGEKVPKYRFKEFEKDGEWVEKKIIETTDKKIKWNFTGGPFGSNLKASDYTTEGIRIIQLQNIGDGEFNNEYKIYTSKEKADELLSCNIYSDEIILSKMGDPVGRACIIPSYLNRCVMASDGIRLVVDEKKYSKYFIYSIINSKQIREAIEKKSTGSTRKRIGLDELKGIELMIPNTIKEQQKIASCLSSLDALITAQTEKIEQLKLHKKGLMQGLFPKIND